MKSTIGNLFGKKRSGSVMAPNLQEEIINAQKTTLNVVSPSVTPQRRGTVMGPPPTIKIDIDDKLGVSTQSSVASPRIVKKENAVVVQTIDVPSIKSNNRKSIKETVKHDSMPSIKIESGEGLIFKQYFAERIPSEPLFDDKMSLPVFSSEAILDEQKKVRIKVFYMIPHESKPWFTQLVVSSSMKCAEFYDQVFDALKRREKIPYGVESILIKARGLNEFVFGSNLVLSQFEYIRGCLLSGQLIELSVIHVSKVTNAGVSSLVPSSGSRDRDYQVDFKTYPGEDLSERVEDQVISSWDLTKKPLRIFVKNLVLGEKRIEEGWILFLVCKLAYGKVLLAEPQVSSIMDRKGDTFSCMIVFNDIHLPDIPKEAHILFELMGTPTKTIESGNFEKTQGMESGSRVGWSRMFLYDHKSELKTGNASLRLWNGVPNYSIISSTQNPSPSALVLNIEFDLYVLPVVFPAGKNKNKKRIPTVKLDNIIRQDCLGEMTEKEKLLVWNYRDHLMDTPIALPKVLKSVDWSEHNHIQEVYQSIKKWKKFEEPRLALELLDVEIQDRFVREHAMSVLDRLDDHDLANCMLQLVEIVKFSPFHFSPFNCWLLKRALKSPHLVGHRMFWSLKSQVEEDAFAERFGLLINEYLRVCDYDHKHKLDIQVDVVNTFLKIANNIAQQPKHTKTDELNSLLTKMLKELTLPPKFTTPISMKLECIGLNIDKCRVMSSKKRPLMLNFKNADESGDDIIIFFKAGDDLRQDELTLQMLKIMDSLWKKEGLDLHINAYECVSTGKNCGVIQCVANSTTIAKLSGGLSGSVSSDTILNWIKKESRTQEMIDTAVNNFRDSCAGYLVATHVLGIGDRHNDNVMITKTGDLFHIDFGHFLGNKKSVDLKIAQVERETGPFVFTKAYAHVLGGSESPKFRELQDLTGKAFNILRKNGNLLMILFKIMIHCGLPELEKSKDIEWIRDKLVLEMTEEESAEHFCGLFIESMSNKRQLVMDAVHYWKHHLK